MNDSAERQLLVTLRLRQRRVELGLTQKQVVNRLARCGVHITNRALSSLEHGSGVDITKLPELAQALDCTVTYLVGLTDDPHRWEPDASPPDHGRRRPEPAATAPPRDPDYADGPRSLIISAPVPDRAVGSWREHVSGPE